MAGPRGRAAARWILCAVVAVALHAGVGGLAVWARLDAEAPGAPPQAVLIEFAAAPSLDATSEATLAPPRTPSEAEAPLPPEPSADIRPAPAEPPPEAASEAVRDAVSEGLAAGEAAPLASAPPASDPALAIPAAPSPVLRPPVPSARPARAARATPKADPRPRPTARRSDRPETPPRPSPSHRTQTAAAPASAARQSDRAAAPQAPVAAASPGAVTTWRSQVMAHLNRFKRFPFGAAPGTAGVRFTIGRAGQVLAASLASSGGDALLDQEAVAMVRRSSPVPAPPEGFGGGTVTLSVPVRFTRQ